MNFRKIHYLLVLIFVTQVELRRIQKRGIMDNFGDGLKMAGKMFGINTAADVADLVARAFSKGTSKPTKQTENLLSILQQGIAAPADDAEDSSDQATEQQKFESSQETPPTQSHPKPHEKQKPGTTPTIDQLLDPNRLITNVFRMIGFDATKLGALAINALVLIAHAIGNTILSATRRGIVPGTTFPPSDTENFYDSDERQSRQLRSGTPIDWFMENPSKDMQNLLNEAIDVNLSNKLVQMIADAENQPNEGSCLKMFMCKSAPFIWGMQKSVKKRIGVPGSEQIVEEADPDDHKLFRTSFFYKYMPTLDEYRNHSNYCDEKFANICKSSVETTRGNEIKTNSNPKTKTTRKVHT